MPNITALVPYNYHRRAYAQRLKVITAMQVLASYEEREKTAK
jgi:hypothetical protein